jgi:mono/diheme cytochrome c family protein
VKLKHQHTAASTENQQGIRRRNYFPQLLLGLLLSTCSGSVGAALDRVGDFALLDSDGTFHQLSRYQHRKAVVLMAHSVECEAMPQLLSDYKNIASEFAGDEFEFLLINSEDLDRPALRSLGVELPILEDDGQLISETLNITNAGDVLILNPERLSLFYQGQPSAELASTLNAVAAESVSDTIRQPSMGCAIDYPAKALHAESPPDYASEIAPIIIENCADCHRQGGVGPFALDSYIMVLGWSPMIKEVLLNKRMPPTQVDPYVGHSESARYLDPQDVQKLVHWINNRGPRGESEVDPLEVFAAEDRNVWAFGEPDFIITGPSNEIPSIGVMDYVYDDAELPFDEDKWLRAIQYIAGDESVLHHLVTFVTPPEEDFWGEERVSESVTRRFVGSYLPGKTNAIEFEEGTGVLVPQGHKLSMQFHYVTNGQSTVDETRFGLYFSDEPDLEERLTQAVASRFVLPPNVSDFELRAEHQVQQDIIVTGVRARMNFRGKRMKFVVESPGGQLRELFSVPAYNYGWQPDYLLDEAVPVVAGSTLRVIGAFDNSISNPSNPDPSKEVTFGLESWEEMFTGYFTFYNQ